MRWRGIPVIAIGTITVEAGSIDTKAAQGKIVSIMEGGKEAFKRRKTIYEIWAAAAAEV